jgi:hypothetical protein
MDLLVELEDEPDVRTILESAFGLKQAFDDIQSAGGGEICSAARDNQLDPSLSPSTMPSSSRAPSSGPSPAPSTGPQALPCWWPSQPMPSLPAHRLFSEPIRENDSDLANDCTHQLGEAEADPRDMTLAAVMDLLVELEDEPDAGPILESRFRLKQAFDVIQSAGGGAICSATRDNQVDSKLSEPSSWPSSMPSSSRAPSSGSSAAPSTGPWALPFGGSLKPCLV